MTEEALDPAAEPADEGAAEPRPRPKRRRRRGGRGRRRSPASTRTSSEAAEAADEPDSTASSEASDDAPQELPEPPDEGGAEDEDAGSAAVADASNGAATQRKSTRRRRRGGRGRRKKPAGETTQAGEATEAVEAVAEPEPAKEPPKPRRQRKTEPKPKPETKPEKERAAPTRTSRPARKTASDRRRRQPVLHQPRRTDKTMLVTEHHDRLQIAVVEGRELMEHYVARTGARSMVGNIYLGKVQNVLPGMEAAFVDIGRGRNAVLYAGEVSYDEDVGSDARRIETVLKPGQSVRVQVTKDPLRGKGARLTAQISLPGRFLVYVPEGQMGGISRRLPDRERERLRRIMKKIRPEEGGVIVRTAAEGAGERELAADLGRLREQWQDIEKKSKRAKAPKALYEEPELVERVVRDVFSPAEFQQIVIDARDVYDNVLGYFEDVAPELADRVKFHDGPLPLFDAFHVTEQIHKALERKVWLPSGGYVVIDRTEAMTIIDVNTGKHVGKTNLEQTVTGTNLEAAREIARQLRLRDIGGIIVIDFIDMMLQGNREEVIQTLKEELAHDKTRSQVFDITPLGLLEMTRKKVSAGLVEAFSEPCPTCEGRGILITHDV